MRFNDDKIGSVIDSFNIALDPSKRGALGLPGHTASPHAPEINEQMIIIDRACELMPPQPQLPWYVWHMCANRDIFQGVALTDGMLQDFDTAYLFVRGKKKRTKLRS